LLLLGKGGPAKSGEKRGGEILTTTRIQYLASLINIGGTEGEKGGYSQTQRRSEIVKQKRKLRIVLREKGGTDRANGKKDFCKSLKVLDQHSLSFFGELCRTDKGSCMPRKKSKSPAG